MENWHYSSAATVELMIEDILNDDVIKLTRKNDRLSLDLLQLKSNTMNNIPAARWFLHYQMTAQIVFLLAYSVLSVSPFSWLEHPSRYNSPRHTPTMRRKRRRSTLPNKYLLLLHMKSSEELSEHLEFLKSHTIRSRTTFKLTYNLRKFPHYCS